MRLLAHDMTGPNTRDDQLPAKIKQTEGRECHTRIDRKINRVNSHHRQRNRKPPHRVAAVVAHKQADNLPREAQHQEARRHNHRPDDHQRPPPAPWRRALVRHDADDGLDDEAGERAGDPDERGVALGEAQVEEIWGAVCGFCTICTVSELPLIEARPIKEYAIAGSR
ncbi:hypothetical protein TARUN_10281 [Trichoderma arundinaceum]|uniref:Uncharacterized protein n=1 Tax=Trichoderma arundinaceum TaxID=490622 RepID=A0A395N7Z3_TRIAR|nr:hypothetical protein TARUN_10281 [Trichoderma arundinaceum]